MEGTLKNALFVATLAEFEYVAESSICSLKVDMPSKKLSRTRDHERKKGAKS